MKLKILAGAVLGLSFTSICVGAFASVHPVVSVALGEDVANIGMNQNIQIISPYYNTYSGNFHNNKLAGGIFLGVETPLMNSIFGQFGLSYYQSNAFLARGRVLQFGDPAFDNLNYNYNIQSQRVFLESKLLGSYKERFHPYVNLGLGEARNKAYGYTETGVTSADVPMIPGFSAHTTHSFAYLVGVGMDVDLNAHMRLGGLYRFVSLGKARLSTSPLQDSSDTLKNNSLNTNEFLVQFSYLI